MIRLFQSAEFSQWQRELRDPVAQFHVASRLSRLQLGQPGDWKALGGGINEMRIHAGPGYRLYFAWRGKDLVLLLCGGDKSDQKRDIERARGIARREFKFD